MGECDLFAVEKQFARIRANFIRILDKTVDEIPVTRTLTQTIDDFAKAQFFFLLHKDKMWLGKMYKLKDVSIVVVIFYFISKEIM